MLHVITTVADKFDFFFFSEKIKLDISGESSSKQTQLIHMKGQVLISLKNNKKKN